MALNSDCKVTISNDSMSASLYLTPPVSGENYTIQDIVDFLRHNGVNNGIIFSVIEEIVGKGMYYKDLKVAAGSEPVHGENGYYEFFFETENEVKHPVIRSDGSVDYQSMSVIHNVRVGDVLAVYHPAVQGSHGMDVTGREFRAHVGKELPILHGSGFDVSYDGKTYTASVEGKVEYENYKLFVKDVYEFRGDLDLIVGKIDFRGDVIIHGNVCAGTMIRASKSITVEGSAEAATLIAEGDIILQKGMQGGKKARIISGGNVYANFIEYATVEAKGNVEANIIMNCKISAGKEIIISGKRGTLVGGMAYCVGTVQTSFVGNPAGIRTTVAVGTNDETQRRNHLLIVKEDALKVSLAKTLFEMQQLRNGAITESKDVIEAKRKQLERRKLRDERMLSHVQEELGEIESDMRLSKTSKISVTNTAYKSSVIRIDDRELILRSDAKAVEYFRPDLNSEIASKELAT